jgi:hypothetical protein
MDLTELVRLPIGTTLDANEYDLPTDQRRKEIMIPVRELEQAWVPFNPRELVCGEFIRVVLQRNNITGLWERVE